MNFVSARYFETVGMRMTHGRALNEGDGYGAQKTAVVNEALVRGGSASGTRSERR